MERRSQVGLGSDLREHPRRLVHQNVIPCPLPHLQQGASAFHRQAEAIRGGETLPPAVAGKSLVSGEPCESTSQPKCFGQPRDNSATGAAYGTSAGTSRDLERGGAV